MPVFSGFALSVMAQMTVLFQQNFETLELISKPFFSFYSGFHWSRIQRKTTLIAVVNQNTSLLAISSKK